MREDEDFRIAWRDDEATPSAAELQAGRTSKYAQQLKLKPGQLCVVWGRESTDAQAKNMEGQVVNVRQDIERASCIVVQVIERTVSGKVIEKGKKGKVLEELAAAARVAKQFGAILVAESTCRFVRNQHYHPKKYPNARPTDAELRLLALATRGVQLMTVLPPDMPLNAVRKYQAERNRRFKGRKARGGRPVTKRPGYMTKRKQQLLPKVIELAANGRSFKDIERSTGIPAATAWRWATKNKHEKA